MYTFFWAATLILSQNFKGLFSSVLHQYQQELFTSIATKSVVIPEQFGDKLGKFVQDHIVALVPVGVINRQAARTRS